MRNQQKVSLAAAAAVLVVVVAASIEARRSWLQRQQEQSDSAASLRLSAGKRNRLALVVSPLSNQLMAVDWSEKPATLNFRAKLSPPSSFESECASSKSIVRLERDQLDKGSGRKLRSCRGEVQVNKCEGSCGSSVKPSVKSASGMIKTCSCCTEGSFRKLQVRLSDCDAGAGAEALASYMDVELEEPVDCRCRSCNNRL